MKNKSLFYIFLIFIILSMGIGSVNASENISNLTSELLGADNHFLSDNELYDNGEMLSAESQATYSDLTDEFNSYSGGNFELAKKLYVYDKGESIEIKYGGIIDGKGAIIDMLGSNIRTFNVNDDIPSSFVIFRNLTIVNANFDGDGSAIYFKNNGSVEYCTFINNTASNNGGAIYFSNQAYVVKSTFENNSASAGGGAIYFKSFGDVSDCEFTHNSVYSDGGAIYFYNNANVRGCEFKNNKANSRNGGAIYTYSSMSVCSVMNCNFTNNSAAIQGGAINSFGNNTIEKCIFVNNSVNSYGGAIFSQIATSVDNCDFINNNADSGGAIYVKGTSKITNSNFFNNSAVNGGGACYFEDICTVNACDFIDNHANNAGAFRMVKGTVNDCTFENNSAIESGGAIVTYEGAVDNCSFKNNFAIAIGGAIYFNDVGCINRSSFYDNSAYNGGAVFFAISGCVDNCNFTNIVSDSNYGAGLFISNQGNISNSNFYNNVAKYFGGAIYLSFGDVENCSFINNFAEYGGGAIYAVFANVTNSKFINNSVMGQNNESLGGAIYLSSGNVEKCNFINNSAYKMGGAIIFTDEGNVKKSNFINNSAFNGGGVFFTISGNVDNCNFTNNQSNSLFGAGIYISGEGNVNNSNFYNNSVEFYGGAIYLYYGNISNSNFYSNHANYYAGAIFLNLGNVENCGFINNSAGYEGGAMFMALGNVSSSYFINNTAGYYGGAIYSAQLYNVENSTFLQNKAGIGSAIFISGNNIYSIIDSTFLDNQANSTSLEIKNLSNSIEIIFMGENNLLNAIYSGVDANLTNVTYWAANGITNTGASRITSHRSNYESGQNIEILTYINDILYLNTTGVTDSNGKILLDAISGHYDITVRHKSDSYYSEIKTKSKFNILGTPTTLNLSYSGRTVIAKVTNAPSGNVVFTVKKGDDVIKISDSTLFNGIATFDAYGLDSGEYNITALYMGSTTHEPSINNITFIYSKKDSTILIEVENITTNQKEIINITVNGESDKKIIAYVNNEKYVVSDGTLTLTSLKEGIYHLTVFWGGDDDYNGQSNSTIFRVINDLDYYINVTSFKSNNKCVNLTAKSNINQYVVGGRLFFVLENLSEIEAEYCDGIWWITYTFPKNGDYNINARYDALDDITINNAIVTIRNDVLFEIHAENIDYDYLVNVSVSLPSDAGGNVTLFIAGKNYSINNIKGSFEYTIPDKLACGNYIVKASYSGDLNYSSNSSFSKFAINKAVPKIIINAPAIVVGNPAIIGVNTSGSGKLTVVLNEKEYVIGGGEAISISNLSSGTYNVFVFYAGDENYTSATNESILTVDKNSTYEFDAKLEIIGEDVIINVDFPEDASGNLTVVFDKYAYEFSLNKTLVINDLKPGKYNMSIKYSGDDKYDSKSVSKVVDVDNVRLIVDNLVKYYGSDEKLIIALVDHDGKAISSKLVNIKINGVDYSRTTGADGTASIAVNLISGNYTVLVDVYEYSLSSEVNVEILSTIYASDVLKVFRNATQYYALFLDVNGKPLIDVDVSFNINGVFYTRSTNGSGYAKLNINLDEGTYILTAINPINGEMKSNTITVIGLIESSDLSKYYKNQSQFIVRLIDSDGSYVGAGEKVTFNINGVFYTRITNETGHACLNINLNPGNYIITTMYKECYKSNNIKVLPVLSAVDLTKKYGSPDQFVASLVDGHGKAFKNQIIGFNINGVFYNRITDNNGQAKLNINLMAGEYIITSSFNECYIANTIKVTV